MANPQERILIVESDPIISDVIGRQALQSAGYQVIIVNDATAAISRALQFSPDVIITNMNLPGLSGKDLLVALTSQNVETPVIVMASKGAEADIMQAFRLGASDYLLWPVREAEAISAVERALRQVRERRERERLARQLQSTNQELQARVRELTTIFSIGKTVTSVTDQTVLIEKILEAAGKVTSADMGWFMQRDDASKTYLLAGMRGLPASLPVQLNQPWDDGISSLVAMSGETLSIHGEPIKRFKISSLGQAALIVPVKVKKQVIGLLIMLRKAPTAFTDSEQHLLQALADYASISLSNARMFKMIESRAQQHQLLAESAQAGEKVSSETLRVVKKELRGPLESARSALERLVKDPTIRWTPNNRADLSTVQDALLQLARAAEAITPLPVGRHAHTSRQVNLNEVVREAVERYQPFAQQNNLSIAPSLPENAVLALADGAQISQVLYGLLSNAIQVSAAGSNILVRLEKTREPQAHVVVIDAGPGLDNRRMGELFNENFQPDPAAPRRFGGLGIGLPLIKEIIIRQNGKIWVESKVGQGSSLHFTLPTPR